MRNASRKTRNKCTAAVRSTAALPRARAIDDVATASLALEDALGRAGVQGITVHEWLHARVLSKAGLLDPDAG